VSAFLLAGSAVWSQQNQKPATPLAVAAATTDVAFTFGTERSEVIPSQCCFWFKGGGVDAVETFWKGIGIAASVTTNTASNVTPDVDVKMYSYKAGPRYTWTGGGTNRPRYQIFAEGLFGGVHAIDGVYPSSSGPASTANAFSLQTGAGVNVFLTPRFSLRLIQAEYVRTDLPNGAGNDQNDLRLSFGVVFHHVGLRHRK
jgi:hypothetical protein